MATLKAEVFKLQGTILRETAAAVLLSFSHPYTGEDTTEWFPLSQVSELHHSGDEDGDSIVMSQWIAAKKGLV